MHWEIISNTVIVIVLSYIIGSIPTSFIAAKILKGIDIREYGSKNIGATNVYRTLGLLPALFVLAIDIGKGLIAVVFISQLSIIGTDSVVNQELIKIIVGIFAIIGHNWTMFLSFKGGKGVATSAGVFFGLTPYVMFVVIIIFIIIVAITKYVSVGSMFCALLYPFLLLVFAEPRIYVVFGLIVFAVVIYKHIPNIKRLISGAENKIKI